VLVFIDESYERPSDPNPKSTFSAVLVEEGKYREFDKNLFEIKRHFWKVTSPHELELKGRLLLTERALNLPKNREFVEQVIALAREVGCVFFAVIQDGAFPLASQEDRLPNLYRGLVRRVNTFMSTHKPEEQALFFFDGIDQKTNRKVAVSFNNFMYRHGMGQTSKNVLPTPFFCDSEVSPGIQMADVFAYCVNQRYGGRRGRLEDIFQQFRALTYNHQVPDEDYTLWGVSRVKPEPAMATPPAIVAEVTIREEVEV